MSPTEALALSGDLLRAKVVEFEHELRAAELAESAIQSYVDQSLRFIRWLEGDYRPRNAPGPATTSSRMRSSWPPAELGEELERFRTELQAARLRPLAIQTYVATSGAFVRWLNGSYSPVGPKRTSHEREAVDALVKALGSTEAKVHRGFAPDNRLPVPDWNLTPLQELQFGDLRLELPTVRVVVEVESAGGIGNLAKYWPLLENTLDDKRFALIHLYRIGSSGDYIAHRRLWAFLLERMRLDVKRTNPWSAQVASYGPAAPADALLRAAELIREELRS